ncbi:MAG: MFS transporter [Granulosicoccus sp.]
MPIDKTSTAAVTESSAETANLSTRWFSVLALYLAGCSLALHAGKVPSALPLLRAELGLSLTQAGSIVSTYALIIAFVGLLMGLAVGVLGYVRFALAGIVLAGIGSLVGAYSDSYALLLVSRAIEGCGWILGVVSLPSMLTRLSSAHDRSLVMGIWGSFVPVGAGLMLFVAPELQMHGGWRLSWQVAGYVSLFAALLVWYISNRQAHCLSSLRRSRQLPPLADLGKPAAWLLAICFCCYSFQFLAVTSFLPTLLLDRQATNATTFAPLELSNAARWTALIIVVNAIGNIAAGWALRHGAAIHQLLSGASLTMAAMAAMIYSGWLPIPMVILAGIVFSMVGGIIPGTLFATVPLIASVPAVAGVLVGAMTQASGVGQWLGPLALPAVVERSGTWMAGGFLMVAVGLSGAWFGRRLRVNAITDH